jgi:hypothetical protein
MKRVSILILLFCAFVKAYDEKNLTDNVWLCNSNSQEGSIAIRLSTEDTYHVNGTFDSAGVMEITENEDGAKFVFDNPVSGTWRIENDKFITSITGYSLKSKDGNQRAKKYEMNGFKGQEIEDVSVITELSKERFTIKSISGGSGDTCHAK